MTDIVKTMKLNHLSFPSTDVPATAEFFVKYLGFTTSVVVAGAYVLKRPGFDVVIELADDDSATSTIVSASKAEAGPYSEWIGDNGKWPKAFHVGFELPDADAVHALHSRFKADGVHVVNEVFNNERGSRFFCRAPGGVMFELNTRADAAPAYQGTFDN